MEYFSYIGVYGIDLQLQQKAAEGWRINSITHGNGTFLLVMERETPDPNKDSHSAFNEHDFEDGGFRYQHVTNATRLMTCGCRSTACTKKVMVTPI